MRRALLLPVCLLVAAPAMAVDIYRCTGADGTIYQDTPCATGHEQSVMHYLDPAPPPPSPPPAPADDTVPTTVAATPEPAPAPAPPAIPPPDFYLCTATDGSRYLSEDGIGRRSQVPYAMVAGTGKSLSQAYGGPNGIGVSAPELQKRPSVPASQDPLAGAYVWVVDECHHADPVEACAYLRNELDKVESKLRRAFSDTEARLKQEQAQLRERARGC